MPTKPLGNSITSRRDVDRDAAEIGRCVVCGCGIFRNDEYGRARRPLLGKAHKHCGGE